MEYHRKVPLGTIVLHYLINSLGQHMVSGYEFCLHIRLPGPDLAQVSQVIILDCLKDLSPCLLRKALEDGIYV